MQVIIGCDGVNSVVASIVGLNSSRHFSTCAIRGVTHYQTLHPFGTAFYLFDKDGVRLGLLPINHNDVYWFLTRKLTSTGTYIHFFITSNVVMVFSPCSKLIGFMYNIDALA